MSAAFREWTCIFPGKMGLSWELAWNASGTKEEAEAQAARNCNVVVVPLSLYEHIKRKERMSTHDAAQVSKPGRKTTEVDPRPLMRQLAAMAGMPQGRIRRMVLVLDVDLEPMLYCESFLEVSDEPLVATNLESAPLTVDTTTMLNEQFRTALPRHKDAQ